ncbi:TetR/AcrR family transcriptional regulator [Trichothermofontia sp.]
MKKSPDTAESPTGSVPAQAEVSRPRSRSYRSSLRQQQAAATRELILRALAEQLAVGGLQEFSIADAAQRAGVATRTIYRYFPNREALLDAVGAWVDQQLGDLPYPTTPMEVAALAEQAFPRFEQTAVLIQALLVSELGKNVRSRLRSKRRQAIATALSPLLAERELAQVIKRHQDRDEDGNQDRSEDNHSDVAQALAPAIAAVIGHLVTAETWQHLRNEFGISGEVSGQAVAWVIRTLITALANLQDGSDLADHTTAHQASLR